MARVSSPVSPSTRPRAGKFILNPGMGTTDLTAGIEFSQAVHLTSGLSLALPPVPLRSGSRIITLKRKMDFLQKAAKAPKKIIFPQWNPLQRLTQAVNWFSTATPSRCDLCDLLFRSIPVFGITDFEGPWWLPCPTPSMSTWIVATISLSVASVKFACGHLRFAPVVVFHFPFQHQNPALRGCGTGSNVGALGKHHTPVVHGEVWPVAGACGARAWTSLPRDDRSVAAPYLGPTTAKLVGRFIGIAGKARPVARVSPPVSSSAPRAGGQEGDPAGTAGPLEGFLRMRSTAECKKQGLTPKDPLSQRIRMSEAFSFAVQSI